MSYQSNTEVMASGSRVAGELSLTNDVPHEDHGMGPGKESQKSHKGDKSENFSMVVRNHQYLKDANIAMDKVENYCLCDINSY